MEVDLNEEANSIESLLSGKSISKIFRPNIDEICVQCTDGTRFFIGIGQNGQLEFSIT